MRTAVVHGLKLAVVKEDGDVGAIDGKGFAFALLEFVDPAEPVVDEAIQIDIVQGCLRDQFPVERGRRRAVCGGIHRDISCGSK
jgi:hypothetical protein